MTQFRKLADRVSLPNVQPPDLLEAGHTWAPTPTFWWLEEMCPLYFVAEDRSGARESRRFETPQTSVKIDE
jgi:hypothetical protein